MRSSTYVDIIHRRSQLGKRCSVVFAAGCSRYARDAPSRSIKLSALSAWASTDFAGPFNHSLSRRVSHVVFLFFTRGFLFCSNRQLCQSHGHLPSLNNLYPLYSTPKPLAKSTPSSNFIPLRFGTNNYNLQNFEHVYRHGFGLIRRVLQGGGSQWSRHCQ